MDSLMKSFDKSCAKMKVREPSVEFLDTLKKYSSRPDEFVFPLDDSELGLSLEKMKHAFDCIKTESNTL